MNQSGNLKSIAPQFIVPDVVVAAEYYRDVLGFEILGYFWTPPVFAMVGRDAVQIHFGRSDTGAAVPNGPHRPDGLDAYIWVTDLDALVADLRARGADIVEGPVVRSYGRREIIVRDLHGFRITFGV